MIELSDRERQIVVYLLSKPNTTAGSMASIFNVSDRTIRNDIKAINRLCHREFIVSGHKGFSIHPDCEDVIEQITLSNKIQDINKQILVELLSSKTVNFYILADSLNISEATLSQHLNVVRKSLKKYDIRFIRKNNELFLEGMARNKRRIYVDMILEGSDSIIYDPLIFQDSFLNIDLKKITKGFLDILKEYGYVIPSFYLNHFLLNLYAILNFDFQDNSDFPEVVDDKIYDLSVEVDHRLNDSCISKVVPIYYSLLGVLNVSTMRMTTFEKEIEQITKKVFEKYSLNIDVSSFLPVLAKHIHDMILRCRNGNPIQTNGGLSIKESAFFIYDVTVSLAGEISKKYHVQINQNEISLIAMHVGFLIENSLDYQLSDDTLRIILNSGSYVWSAHYQKILRDIIPYKCEIVLFSELQNLKDLSKYDFLVTFSKNSKPVSIAQCVISPLFTSSDRIKVTEVVNTIIAKKKKEQFKTLFKLYFNENNFFVQTSLNKREDVLSFLCENLEKEKVVDKEFRSSVFLP